VHRIGLAFDAVDRSRRSAKGAIVDAMVYADVQLSLRSLPENGCD